MDKDIRRDLDYIWHPCSQMKEYEEYPPIKIIRGRGIYLFDKNNKRYIDTISSWWVNLFGHSNKRLNRSIIHQAEQLEHVLLAGYTHDPIIDFAEELIDVVPKGLKKVFFADNGSSAIEAALKMSFQYFAQSGSTKRNFIALSGGYHGETLGALAACGIKLYRDLFSPILMKVSYAQSPSCFACPFKQTMETCNAECFVYMERVLEKIGTNKVAGIIIEPLVQCANRMNMYPPAYLVKLRKLCTENKIHFIADEIAVGFGRTGSMFACGAADISPDIMCLSKGITGGYMPFSAVVATRKIYDGFYGSVKSGRAFLHSHSYTGNPLAASLALTVLRIFRDDNVLVRMKPLIKALAAALHEISSLPGVQNTRQTGLIGAFDLTEKVSGLPFNPDRRMGWKVARTAIRNGVILRPLGDTIYFMPPLIITEREIDRIKEVVIGAVKEAI